MQLVLLACVHIIWLDNLHNQGTIMTSVFHRQTKAIYPTAVNGDGCYIEDSTGKRYLDASGGAAVSCLGHSSKEVRDAIKTQVDKIAYAHTAFFTNEPMEELADLLVKKSPEGIDKVYFVSSGSEAVEAAIKMARQYFIEIGKPQKYKIIARWQSYHGNTLGALSAGGNKWRREQFQPLLIDMKHVPPCYEYRYKRENETSEEYGIRIANRLEEEIQHTGASAVAAFIAEPVVGATMGCVTATKGYFKRIKEICEKYDVLLILDEVMCGMGRTGTMFACEQEGITADLITVAKGLGAGYTPIGALLVSGKIYDAFKNGSGFFQHGHTYVGHAMGCAAALKVQQIIERDNLLDNVNKMGKILFDGMKSNFGDHPYVGDIRGRGLFYGIEFVRDRATKEPFDVLDEVNKKIKSAAMEEGLMCYPMGGTVDGKLGDHVLLAPPFIIEQKHVNEILDKMGRVIKKVL